MNQFFYTRPEQIAGEKEGEVITVLRKDSFNLDMVIRTVEIADDKLVVLLDDIHNRIRQVPNINPKTQKPTGAFKSVEETFQSEIYITVKEEIDLFRKLANINYYEENKKV
jgi:hypothetical protein